MQNDIKALGGDSVAIVRLVLIRVGAEMSTPKKSTPKMSTPEMATVPKCLLPKCIYITYLDPKHYAE